MIEDLIKITKALSDPNRIRILIALKGGELCVCQIIELIGLAPSTVSKHIFLLKYAGFVESRKKGQWIYYRLTRKPSSVVKKGLEFVFFSSKSDITNDKNKLLKIKSFSLNSVCEKYRKGKKRK